MNYGRAVEKKNADFVYALICINHLFFLAQNLCNKKRTRNGRQKNYDYRDGKIFINRIQSRLKSPLMSPKNQGYPRMGGNTLRFHAFAENLETTFFFSHKTTDTLHRCIIEEKL